MLSQGNIWASGINVVLRAANDPLPTTKTGGPIKYLHVVDSNGNTIVPTYDIGGLQTPDGTISGAKFVLVSAAEFAALKDRVEALENDAGGGLLHGEGAPSNDLGDDGDTYIDDANSMLYGPKAAGVWPAGTSLVGQAGEPGPSADGTLIASLSSSVTIVGAVNTVLHTIPMTAPSSKRLVLVTSAYVSPDDGTTSGYHIRTAARVRRQAGGTHTVDQSIYLLNMEQNSTADAGFTGGASLVAFFLGVAGTTIVVTRADVWEL